MIQQARKGPGKQARCSRTAANEGNPRRLHRQIANVTTRTSITPNEHGTIGFGNTSVGPFGFAFDGAAVVAAIASTGDAGRRKHP